MVSPKTLWSFRSAPVKHTGSVGVRTIGGGVDTLTVGGIPWGYQHSRTALPDIFPGTLVQMDSNDPTGKTLQELDTVGWWHGITKASTFSSASLSGEAATLGL